MSSSSIDELILAVSCSSRVCVVCKRDKIDRWFLKDAKNLNPEAGFYKSCWDCRQEQKERQTISKKLHSIKKCSTCKKDKPHYCFVKHHTNFKLFFKTCDGCRDRNKIIPTQQCTKCKKTLKISLFPPGDFYAYKIKSEKSKGICLICR